jgi:integration host factor subunit alpha
MSATLSEFEAMFFAMFFEEVKRHLARGEEVRLAGFGIFTVITSPARVVRDRQTGAPINVPAKNIVKFSPSQTFKDRLRRAAKKGQ